MFIVIAVLLFGFLILIHEFGHYITARLCHVTIMEFSIGMGPKLVWYESKKTGIKYCISMLPLGGYVSMAGEDEESDDPNSFDKKPVWQRLIITFAGAAVNIIAGFIAMAFLVMFTRVGSTEIRGFISADYTGYEISSMDSGLMVGDEIIKVDGRRVHVYDELAYEIMRKGTEPLEVTVIRDGQELDLTVVFPKYEVQGQVVGDIDFVSTDLVKTPWSVISATFEKSWLVVRMCWESIFDLISGRYSLSAVSGPVGISAAIGEAAKFGLEPFVYLSAIITINLGVMNLLPIPALDGGRILFLLCELVARKKLPSKLEANINAVGLLLLLGLSVVILIKDVWTLVA